MKPAPAPKAAAGVAARAIAGLTLAEAFHLLSRALGELPAPVPHETLRARMAALHGKEDSLLEPSRFAKLLRQANDAEIADIRMVAENQYEISPHKADLAFKLQARQPAEASASGTVPAPPAIRQPAALRFRGGSRTGARPSELQMVGVVNLNAGVPVPPAAVASAPVVAEPAPVAAEPVASELPAAIIRPKTRRGKRGGKKHQPQAAGTAEAVEATAPAVAVKVAKSAKVTKPSTRRTSKPRAG